MNSLPSQIMELTNGKAGGALPLDAKWAASHTHSSTTTSTTTTTRSHSDSSAGSSSSPDDNDSETTAPPSLTPGSTMPSEESLEDATRRLDDAHKESESALVHRSAPHLGAIEDNGSDGNLLKHAEFGWDANPAYRYTSQHIPGSALPKTDEEEPSYAIVLLTYFSYIVLIGVGHLRDYVGKHLFPKSYKHLMQSNGYAALNSDFDSFYTRRLKTRLDDCFSRPVTGVCGRTVVCLDRSTNDYNETFKLTGTKTRALNISGYNYLGFAQSQGGCADNVEEVLKRYGVSSYGSRLGTGHLDLQQQTEKLVARFLGTEDSMVISMGFATNSTSIPAIASPGTLIISDEYNHSSIRFGARLSRSHIRQYKHNNMEQLESLLRECISQGMPRTHRPWKKILVIVEGLYSMEGSLVNLPEIMRLKRKYKFYLYVDEAHSVGAIGPRGRGVCDYFGVDPRQVDILMGTFTKSFGAAGGYIGGSKAVIDRIRLLNHSNVYGETLSPPVLTQIITSMASIMGVGNNPEEAALLPEWIDLPRSLADGSEGLERLRRLAFNSRYLSSGLRKLGFIVFGHRDSPIVPLLIYLPGKMGSFSRMMLYRDMSLPPDERLVRDEKDLSERERLALEDPTSSWALSGRARPPIVVVVVAYPATPLISSRVRFCVSSAHTKKDIDDVLIACDEVGGVLDLKYQNGGPGGRWTIDQVLSRSTELVAWDGKSAI
ncbi:hypothetical protein CF327_g1645 [Tilletia walkeri]|nr:hypothetical protein CF327_g1645 [Tilletia walkeri]